MNAVNQWGGEARDYNIVRNTCAGEPNSIHHQWRKCAHYTQIVSATTTKVGCARSVCPNLTFPITIVCNFGNAGNVYRCDHRHRQSTVRADRGRGPVTPGPSEAAGRRDSTRFFAAFLRADFTARPFGFSRGGSGFPVNAS